MNCLYCSKCLKAFSLEEPIWRCTCGSFLDIKYEFPFQIESIKTKEPSLWRYSNAFPIKSEQNRISFNEGFTPLVPFRIFNKNIFIKLDYLFPTGSFKDRGTTILISKLQELGVKKIIEDSSGNAGASFAAYSTRAGIECHIFVPEYASQGKITQIQMYGAIIHKISGNRTDTKEAALEYAEKFYYASHAWNPFYFQGTKTLAYEIWEQLNYTIPDKIIVPIGSGSNLIGLYLGFNELLEKKLIKKMPVLIGVQSENCAPLYFMMYNNAKDLSPRDFKQTCAEGISITTPVRGSQILEMIRKTNGSIITISEAEIIESLRQVCQHGIFIEPTSAVAFAAINKISIGENDKIIIPITGNGLKATDKIMKLIEE